MEPEPMVDPPSGTPVPNPPRPRPALAARRTGYVIAAVVDTVLLVLIHVSPGWRAAPFLTEAAADVMPLVTFSLVAGIAVNAVWLARDPLWLRSLGDLVTTVISVVVVARVLAAFPFPLDEGSLWRTAVRVGLVGVLIGTSIATVTHLALLIRRLVGTQPQG